MAVTFGASRLQAAAQALQSGATASGPAAADDLAGPIADIEAAAIVTKEAVAPAVAALHSA